MTPTILCPTDFSKHSRAALDYAANLADRADGTVLVLHVESPPMVETVAEGASVGAFPPPGDPPIEGLAPDSKQNVPESPTAGDRLQQFMPPSNVSFEHVLQQGEPAEQIVQVADKRNVDHIVMGTHGHTGVTRWLLGSTAEAVVREADCPVTVVKAPLPSVEEQAE